MFLLFFEGFATNYSYDNNYQLIQAQKRKKRTSFKLLNCFYKKANNSSGKKAGFIKDKINSIINRLSSVYDISYSYDSVGNRIAKKIQNAPYLNELKPGQYEYFHDNDNKLIREEYRKTTYGWGSWNRRYSNRFSRKEITNFEYDLNGNLLKEKTGNHISNYLYDASNNMVKSEVPGKKTVGFLFNGDNQRIARLFRRKGQSRSYKSKRKHGKEDDDSECDLFNLNNRHSSWQADTKFVYSGAEVIAELDGKDNVESTYTLGAGIDNLISVTKYNKRGRGTSYFATTDHLGSVRELTDRRGRKVNSYSYTPFGVAYNVKEKVQQPYRYTGRRWDPNVGKLWYRSRHYAAGRGVFSQADKWNNSVMNPVGYHAFGYVMGNPVIWKDPYGLKFYDFKTSSKAEILNGIKNDDWFIFSGHGSASHFYQPTYLNSEFIGSFIYPIMYAPASISPEEGYGEWSISLYDEDFYNAIKERRDSGKKLEMSIFFACESVEMARALAGISDVSIGMENSENKFVLWKYAELFSAAVESGKSISKAILEAENLGSDFLNMASQSTLRRISYSITNPVVKNVEYDPKNFHLENCDKKGE